MSRAAFTHADVQRAIKAALSAGQAVASIDFPPAGGFRLILGEPQRLDPQQGTGGRNEWDDVLTPS